MSGSIAIHHPDDYDTSLEDEAMHRDIDALNDEMKAAGVRVFVGGLQHPAGSAKSLRARPDGEVLITDGPYLETKDARPSPPVGHRSRCASLIDFFRQN